MLPLQRTLNFLMDPQQIPNSFLLAHVTVLPKVGKDPTKCTSYKPVSMLNLDLKFLAKIVANDLCTFLPQLISPEQVGFMPGREAWDNVTKALNLIHHSCQAGFEGFLLSTDAEKAFDRVSWDILLATCSHIVLKPHILMWITLYQNPLAKLKINGTVSELVSIKNGTRQGCPLSPLLFLLSLEPFICSS